MGFWAGIKHALNSTLGTAEFKPLDKLILDNIKVAASDVVIKFLINSSTQIPVIDQTTAMTYFVAKASGTVRVKANYNSNSSIATATKTLWCVRGSTGEILTSAASAEDAGVMSIDFNIVKGERYFIHMSVNRVAGGYDKCKNISVCGSSYFGNLIS